MPETVTQPPTAQQLNAKPRLFAGAFFVATFAVLGTSWFSGIRETFNVAMGSVLSVAFFPFNLILGLATLVLIVVCVGVIASLLAAEAGAALAIDAVGEGVASAPAEVIPVASYYRWLFSIRHPLFWGTLAGLFAGALILLALIAVLIYPGEAETARILNAAQKRIESTYEATGNYPVPTPEGRLQLDGVDVLDGFGRPLVYTVTGRWKLKSYGLASSGYDPQSVEDDMAVSGSMKQAIVQKLLKSVKETFDTIINMKKNKNAHP